MWEVFGWLMGWWSAVVVVELAAVVGGQQGLAKSVEKERGKSLSALCLSFYLVANESNKYLAEILSPQKYLLLIIIRCK